MNKPAEKDPAALADPWDKGDAIVLQPDEGESWWQLVPANGYSIVNDGPTDFKMTWTYLPPGIHNFFAAIGKPRNAGDPAPAPFARPDNTLAAEKAAGFGPKIGD